MERHVWRSTITINDDEYFVFWRRFGFVSFSALTPVTVGQTQVLRVSFIRIDECPLHHITIDLVLGMRVLPDDDCWCRWHRLTLIRMGQCRSERYNHGDA